MANTKRQPGKKAETDSGYTMMSLRFPTERKERIAELAEQNGTTQTQVVNQLVDEGLFLEGWMDEVRKVLVMENPFGGEPYVPDRASCMAFFETAIVLTLKKAQDEKNALPAITWGVRDGAQIEMLGTALPRRDERSGEEPLVG